MGQISRFINKPKGSHMIAAKRVLRYHKGTLEFGVLFPTVADQNCSVLSVYSDVDWCGDRIDRRSTTHYLFLFLGAPICWCSRKQPVVAISNCEVKYIVGVYAYGQAIWLHYVLKELIIKVKKPMKLLIDNKPTINLEEEKISLS